MSWQFQLLAADQKPTVIHQKEHTALSQVKHGIVRETKAKLEHALPSVEITFTLSHVGYTAGLSCLVVDAG